MERMEVYKGKSSKVAKKSRRNKAWVRTGGFLLIIVFVFLSVRYFHAEQFWKETRKFFVDNPLILLIVTICYFLSFCLRAEAWRIYLGKKVRYFSCLQGLLFSLFINHITPIKAGDAVRIGVLSWREKHISTSISAHSVVVLRVLDMLILLLFSFMGLLAFSRGILFKSSIVLLIAAFVFIILAIWFLRRYLPKLFKKHLHLLKNSFQAKNFLPIFTLTVLSWALEGVVVFGVTSSIGQHLGPFKAIWVNSITVGGQVFQITPGGISTYESVMTAALTSFHYPVREGYMVALISHSYKFIFSYFAGIMLLLISPAVKMQQIKALLRLRRG
ncbi:flippase-like domain-containing protein [Bacillus salipaludis]|uniref:Phosphatidylglycerol lysyltransferase n=1 Tax=Bacillus salipaludis TaxID=2547811 RepID=A0A4R5VVU5_9BACI|nr:lysylphosphatidylglycerol synthase transmembrane domain-containing protein [Bacillus salipaludis]TDK63157.1 flippase-like domain-containing protein [Bacillus salipaludis]